jgi:signal transduction histidine kinase
LNTDFQLEIEKYKRSFTIKISGILAVSILCIVGVVIYFELKLNALVGAVYLQDADAADTVTYVLFRKLVTARNLSAVNQAMKASGHTENGAWYLFLNSGQFMLILIVSIILLVLAFFVIKEALQIGQHDIYGKMQEVIFENVKMNKELEAKNNLLEKQRIQIQEFVENIAHQIKTPLAGISLILDRMEPKELADKAFYQVKKVSEFIYRLLNISRIESGKVQLSFEKIQLRSMLLEAVSAIESDQNMDKISLVCDEDMDIVGDEKWLIECLVNIISNCVESIQNLNQDRGVVVIHVENAGEKCVITVSDNGTGFLKEPTESIFDRFETNRNCEEFHVGIGLNLSKLIVLAHHGTIIASNSEEYGGAEFRITLPQYRLKKKL